jgi:hypothetical protein
MEWIRGDEYSVLVHGADEPQRLTYLFGASAGGRFLPELSGLRVFVNENGQQVEYRGKDIVSVVSWTHQTELTVDLSDSEKSMVVPKVGESTEDRP